MKDKIMSYWTSRNDIQKGLLIGLFATAIIFYNMGTSVEAILTALAVGLISGSSALLLGRETTQNKFSIGLIVGGFLILALAQMGQLVVMSTLSVVILFMSGIASIAAFELFKKWDTFDVGIATGVMSSMFALAFTGVLPIKAWTMPLVLVLVSTGAAYLVYQIYRMLHAQIPALNLGEYNVVYAPMAVLLVGFITLQATSLIPMGTVYSIATVVDTPISWIADTIFYPALNFVGLGSSGMAGVFTTGEIVSEPTEGTIFTTFEEEARRFTYAKAVNQSPANIQVISPGAMAVAPTTYVGRPIWISPTKPYVLKQMTVNLKTNGMSVPVDVLFNENQATISSTYLIPSAITLIEGQTSDFVLVRMPTGTFKCKFSVISLSNEDARIYVSKLVPA